MDLSKNFYLPIESYSPLGDSYGCDDVTEEHMPKPISDANNLLSQLGEPFIADTGINDGYPILSWQKEN